MAAFLPFSRPWDRQPPWPVGLASAFQNRGNILFSAGSRGVYGGAYGESGTITWTPTAGGLGAQPSTTSDYISAGRVRLIDANQGAGILIAFVPRTTSQRAFGGTGSSGMELEQVLLNSNSGSDPSAGRVCLVVRDSSAGMVRFATTNAVLTTGKLHILLFEVLDGQNGRITLDGVDQAVTHANNATYGGSGLSANSYDIGNQNGNGTHSLGGGADILLFARLHGRGFDRFALTRDMRGALSIVEPRRVWVPLAAAGSGSTGTSATTNANDTSSASGTTTVTGALARTNANDTPSAGGTTTVLATSATTNAADTSNASGSVGDSVTGSSATTNAADTSSAAGTTTVTGASARTNADDAASAAGTTTVLGTLSRTNANDAAAASGVAGVVTGTAAATNAPDTAAAAGSGGATPAPTGGGGWAWAAPRKKRHDYLSPPTREQMAERVRKQREALGILPKPAQKRIEAAVKKEARRAEPSLAPLAPLAVEVAQDSGLALQRVIEAIQATFEQQRGLVAARMEADAAQRQEREAAEAEQARIEAEAFEQDRQQRLVKLRADDDELLKRADAERQQAIKTIRQVQKALLALIS